MRPKHINSVLFFYTSKLFEEHRDFSVGHRLSGIALKHLAILVIRTRFDSLSILDPLNPSK
jgi:hypothetical protein